MKQPPLLPEAYMQLFTVVALCLLFGVIGIFFWRLQSNERDKEKQRNKRKKK